MGSTRHGAGAVGNPRARRISSFLRADQYRLLKAFAALLGISISALVRLAIERYLEEHATPEAFAALARRMR